MDSYSVVFKDTQWTVAHLSFVTGHKSVSTGVIVLDPQIGCFGWTVPSTWTQC